MGWRPPPMFISLLRLQIVSIFPTSQQQQPASTGPNGLVLWVGLESRTLSGRGGGRFMIHYFRFVLLHVLAKELKPSSSHSEWVEPTVHALSVFEMWSGEAVPTVGGCTRIGNRSRAFPRLELKLSARQAKTYLRFRCAYTGQNKKIAFSLSCLIIFA